MVPVTRDEVDTVIRWLADQGFNVKALTTLPSGEIDLTIRLPR